MRFTDTSETSRGKRIMTQIKVVAIISVAVALVDLFFDTFRGNGPFMGFIILVFWGLLPAQAYLMSENRRLSEKIRDMELEYWIQKNIK